MKWIIDRNPEEVGEYYLVDSSHWTEVCVLLWDGERCLDQYELGVDDVTMEVNGWMNLPKRIKK